MLPFFDRADTKWPQLTDCLHFYIAPERGDPIRDQFARMTAGLRNRRGIGPQPAEFLHVTVQRLNAYVLDLANPDFPPPEAIGDLCARTPSFELRFTAPTIQREAIEAISPPNPQWQRMVEGIGEVFVSSGAANFLEAPPFAPHYSLAYCTAPVDDEPVRAIVERDAAATSFWARRLLLVGVTQNRRSGVFSFRTIHQWALN